MPEGWPGITVGEDVVEAGEVGDVGDVTLNSALARTPEVADPVAGS